MRSSPTGKTKDAGWQIGVSRTVKADVDEVWSYLMSPEGLATWLGGGLKTPLEVGQPFRTNDDTRGEIRSLRSHDRVRLTWQPSDRHDPATVQITVAPAATGCTIRFHTERLDNSDEREQMRTHWKAVADEIEGDLSTRKQRGTR